jgi:general secretion pathway protein A
MFEDFYRLVGPPFKLGPDHRFFFPSKNHDKALSYLRYGLQQDEGFIVVTGDIGAGKTTLVSQLFSELDRTRFLAAQIVTSNIDADDALRMILSAFGVTPHSNDKAALLRSFEAFLMAQHRAGRRVLMVVDEAQNLPPRTIEELRMLSNFTVGGQALFQSFLVGQPQFKEMLADPSLEQFRQRVIASYHLGPMSAEETADYIRHRLTLVGWRNDPAIEPEAFDLIYRHSGGIPRRINTLCSRLLLYGALEGLHIIDAPAVQDVIADLRTEVTEAPSKPLAAKMNGHAANGHAVNGHEVASLMASIEQLTDTVNSHDRALRQLLETALEMLAVNSATTNSATVVKAGDADERA